MLSWRIRVEFQGRMKGIDLQLELGQSGTAKPGWEAAERAGLQEVFHPSNGVSPLPTKKWPMQTV